MASVKVKDLPGLDGEYEMVTMDQFTTGEWRTIKRQTGLRLGEFEEAFDKFDPDALAATAWVALTRAGHKGPAVWIALDKVTPFDHIELVGDEADEEAEGDDAGPPGDTPGDDSESDSPKSDDAETSSSNGSSRSSGPLVSLPPPTGAAPSDTGQVSLPATSAS